MKRHLYTHSNAARWLATAVLATLGTAAPLAAQQGSVTGVVTQVADGAPLPGAQVSIQGTTRGALTNDEGRYLIPAVPVGEHVVRVSHIGFAQVSQQVTVTVGAAATADFAVTESAIALGALVVTATGRQQTKREIGSSIGVIDLDDVELGPVQTFSDLLQGRSAGTVVLQSSGTTGSGSRIRIRGSNSLSLSNAPLLVIDGVRVESDPGDLGFGVGGQNISRLDDLNPENIESIEVLKGPAASALYGTAAANGVIQVTTRRGRAGDPEFHVWSELGRLERAVAFPTNVMAVTGTGFPCPIFEQADGSCSPAETHTFNPLENPQTTPFADGSRDVVGASVSGGSDAATFFVSLERTAERGVYEIDNTLERYSVQTNASGQAAENLDIRASVGYVESDYQLPQGDNALFGIIGMGLGGAPTPGNVAGTQGYENRREFHDDWKTFQGISRLSGSVSAEWRPRPWLSVNGVAGAERITQEEMNRIPRESAYSIFGSVFENGFIQILDTDRYNIDSNASATGVFNLTEDVVSSTTMGTSFIRQDFHQIYTFGAGLTPGIEESLSGATSDYDAGEANILNATVSAFAQQQFAWRDRLFLNGAVRGDQNTAFGTDIGWIWYPSASGSWILSEEEFFPRPDFMSEFRVRGAFGQAGLRPGPTDALQSFSGAVGVFQNADLSAIVINEIGNTELRPERTREWEAGFETGLFQGRLGVDLVYYRKTSEDALISRPLPPSTGGSATRFENLGEVRNSGIELLLNGDAYRSDDLRWGFTLSGSWNDNELVDLGEDAEGDPIPSIELGIQRHVEGYPLGGYWEEPIESFADANGDGLLSRSEVVLGDSVQYFGNSLPTRELTLSSRVTVRDWLRVSVLLDHKGGHVLWNQTEGWRCAFSINCADVYDQDLPLERQAAIIAVEDASSYAGFFEDGDFTKLRELAVTFRVPGAWTSAARVEDLSLTLAGRNLKTWTDYSGFDPEVNRFGTANFASGDFFTLPPSRTFSIRLDARF